MIAGLLIFFRKQIRFHNSNLNLSSVIQQQEFNQSEEPWQVLDRSM